MPESRYFQKRKKIKMANKYHIGHSGAPTVCVAQPGNCPLGGMDEHSYSIKEVENMADGFNASLVEYETTGKIGKLSPDVTRSYVIGVRRALRQGLIDVENVSEYSYLKTLENKADNIITAINDENEAEKQSAIKEFNKNSDKLLGPERVDPNWEPKLPNADLEKARLEVYKEAVEKANLIDKFPTEWEVSNGVVQVTPEMVHNMKRPLEDYSPRQQRRIRAKMREAQKVLDSYIKEKRTLRLKQDTNQNGDWSYQLVGYSPTLETYAYRVQYKDNPEQIVTTRIAKNDDGYYQSGSSNHGVEYESILNKQFDRSYSTEKFYSHKGWGQGGLNPLQNHEIIR